MIYGLGGGEGGRTRLWLLNERHVIGWKDGRSHPIRISTGQTNFSRASLVSDALSSMVSRRWRCVSIAFPRESRGNRHSDSIDSHAKQCSTERENAARLPAPREGKLLRRRDAVTSIVSTFNLLLPWTPSAPALADRGKVRDRSRQVRQFSFSCCFFLPPALDSSWSKVRRRSAVLETSRSSSPGYAARSTCSSSDYRSIGVKERARRVNREDAVAVTNPGGIDQRNRLVVVISAGLVVSYSAATILTAPTQISMCRFSSR